MVTSPIRQVRLTEPAVYYDYVYAIKQGVDSTIYYEASSTQVSLYRPFLNRPLYQPALETGGPIEEISVESPIRQNCGWAHSVL